jgi:hypothetical protein
MNKVIGYDIDDVLSLLGVARKRSLLGDILPALGLIALGAAVGAGVGLAFAPSPGNRLRRELLEGVGGRLGQFRARIKRERKEHTNNVSAHST